MADLITQDYLTGSLADYGLTTGQVALLPGLAAAASRLVRAWCNRQFTRATYDQLYTADRRSPLLLREFPVNAIERLAVNPTAVISIVQSDQATNQRATAALAATGSADAGLVVTGLTLVRVASGATTSSTLLFASSVTLNALAQAVAALGAGWRATVAPGYGLWPTADLRAVQGTLPCLGSNTADFKIHVDEVSSFELDADAGLVDLGADGSGDPFASLRWGPGVSTEAGDLDLRPGRNNVRVVYDAGFDTIPEPVQTACVELVKAQLERFKTDTTLASESDGTYNWSGRMAVDALPASVLQQLALYRSSRA